MRCENCKADLGTMKAKLNRTNEQLAGLGTYYQHLGNAVRAVEEVLRSNGFNDTVGPVVATGLGEYRVHVEVGHDKWLTMTLHRMEVTGNYELVAYVN